MFVQPRKLPEHEILPLMKKLASMANESNCEVSYDNDDEIWFMNINWDSYSLTEGKMTSHGKGSANIFEVWVEYYPPKSETVRFDFCVSRRFRNDVFAKLPSDQIEEVLTIYSELVKKFGHAGKNSVSDFEQL